MCQAVRDGGRRCSVHRHTSIAAIRSAAHQSGLTRYQTERLFAELRKEGHGSRRLSQRQREIVAEKALEAVAGNETLTEKVQRDIDLGFEHDVDLDGQTGYALRLLQQRASDRATALDNKFAEIADRAGLTKAEVAEKYAEYMNGFVRPRGGAYPEEYNQNTRRRAAIANLPYDVASVYALERIQRLGTNERRRRVQHVEAGATSQLASYGYDNGRLEVTLRSEPGQVYAYRNVPEQVWVAMSSSPRPASVWVRSVRGNPDYQYSSAVAAEDDAYAVRCASCGQFAAVSGHSCPERVQREELAEQGLTGEQIRETLAATTGNNSAVQVEGNAETVEEQSEVLPAPETDEEAATESPLEAAEASGESFVLPAAEYEAVNIYRDVEELPDTMGDIPDHIDVSKHYGSNRYDEFSELFGRNELSAEEQLNNTYVNPDEARRVLYLDSLHQVQLVNADTLYRLRYGRMTSLENDTEFNQKVRNTPSNIYYIVVQEGENSEPYVYGTYDENVFTASTNWNTVNGRRGTRSVTMKARGLVETTASYAEQAEQREREGAEFIEALSARDDVAVVEANSSSSKRFIFDRNAPASNQPKVKTGRVAQLRKAFKDGKVAIVPIEVESSTGNPSHVADRSGLRPPSGYGTVSGNVAVRRREDGAVEVISDERTLKCDCSAYRNHYDCPHVRYANRNIANVIAKQAFVAPPGSHHSLLTSGLAGRGDVQVVEPRTLDDGTVTDPVISFGETMPRVLEPREENSWNGVRERAVLPNNLAHYSTVDPDDATFEQVQEIYNYGEVLQRLTKVEVPGSPSALRVAIKRANTQVPIRVEFQREEGITPTITGAVTYKKADTAQESSVVEHTLKCSCPKYQEDYDCEHVRFVLTQPSMVLNSGSRNVVTGSDSVSNTMSRFAGRIAENNRVLHTMRQSPELSFEEASEQVREEIRQEQEARERAERERIERQRRETEERIRRERHRAEQIEAANSETVAASDRYREAMLQRWENVEGSYAENMSEFYNDVRAAERRKANGEAPIEFRTENVTDGVCAPGEGTRSFGIELEFDIKNGVDRRTALTNIGRELYNAGLTPSASMRGYHAGAASGWEKWSFESDCTVAGEIVSPIMKDTPEHWEQLKKVCEIITRNGGKASVRTGSHVHISTASYGRSTAKHAELLRQSTTHQDILFRLASNPERGKHRGSNWCPPNTTDYNGEIPVELRDGTRSLRGTMGHRSAVNFDATASTSYSRSHAEFRMWDGSLDPAVIQQQVVVSAALADLAERKVIANNGSFPLPEPNVQTGRYREREVAAIGERGTHTEETFSELNKDAAKFIDSIVRTPEQRRGIASLFAITKWQRAR